MAFATCMVAIGCRPAEQIHSYNVPKETASRVTADSLSPAPTDRMLVAILPEGNKAWFFKVVAPLTVINEREDELQEFFANLRIAAASPRPTAHWAA